MDATDAPSFVRRSKSKNLRGRDAPATTVADDGEDDTSVATSIRHKQKNRAKPKARLSFGGEEEDSAEEFKVKKSSLSRKLKLASTASSSAAMDSSEDLSASTSSLKYSKEYLSELKASTPSILSSQKTQESFDGEISLDPSELEGAMVVDESIEMEVAPEIPSESSIQAAKEKRGKLREVQSSEDGDGFISLSVARRDNESQGPHPESRLVREEDELGEGDDEFAEYTSAQERIALGKKARKKETEKKKLSMQEMIEDAEEEDEETLEWEKEQVRRGGKGDGSTDGTRPKQEYRPAPIPPLASLPTLDSAISRLSLSLTELTESHAKSTTSMTTLADERQNLEQKEKEMRTMVEKAGQKRSWFNAFREWVETVATFLDEKYPTLEKLEDEHVSLLKERRDMIQKRRDEDDEDDLSLCLGPIATQSQPITVDDMGRVIPQQNQELLRRERLQSRRARRSKRAKSTEEDGYSTDSSLLQSDQADFEEANSKILSDAAALFKDVQSDEFKDPSKGVGKWFGGWRDKYLDSYSAAFGGLGMVSAWEFWVRLEILAWDPTEAPRLLDSFAWYKDLYEYSRPPSIDGEMEDDDTLGPDGDLVSAMISSTVVPRLYKVIRGGGCDVYSAKHVRTVIDLAEQVEASATREKFELLVKAVVETFREVVESTDKLLLPFLERNQAKFDPESVPARRRFLTRRYKLISNMIKWRKHTGECFGIGELIAESVGKVMLPVARGGWEVGGRDVMQKVQGLLPKDLQVDVGL